MNLADFVEQLSKDGILLWLEGDTVKFRAPDSASSKDWQSVLRAHKAEVIKLLKTPKFGPASFSQERIWFVSQLEPDSAVYNIPLLLKFEGELNTKALEHALNEIVKRHETLRTTFSEIKGELSQIVAPFTPILLPMVDLQHHLDIDREAERQRITEAESEYAFNLQQEPLIRFTLLRLKPTEHILLITMHHTVSDGWSLGVLYKELGEFYASYAAGRPPTLPPLEVQYVQFSRWQREWMRSEEFEKQRAYWKKQFEGPIPSLELKTSRSRPPQQTYHGGLHEEFLSQNFALALKTLSQRQGCTLFITLLAAFKTFLHRLTGQTDIIVGSPIAGRTRPEARNMIGAFINNVALRGDLTGNPTFFQLLSRIRHIVWQAQANQDVPFEKILEDVRPERDRSRTPLFQVFFNHFNLSMSEFDLPGVKTETILLRPPLSKFDLTVYAKERKTGIHIEWVYNKDLFDTSIITTMADQFHTLLQNIVADPGQRLSDFALFQGSKPHLPSIMAQNIPTNKSFIEFKREDIEQSIPSRFEDQVRKYPENIAVKTQHHEWTYEKLNRESTRVMSAILKSAGPGEGRVALLFAHDIPMIAGILGVLKAGKTYVPLEPDDPKERLTHVLTNIEANVLLTDNANAALAEELTAERQISINIETLPSTAPPTNFEAPSSPDTLAYILFTSGTTGYPKGIIQNHRNVLHHIRNYTNTLRISADDKLTIFSSYGFDAAVMDIFGALLNGATLCPLSIKNEGVGDIHRALLEREISIYHSTPTAYRYLLNNLRGKHTFPKVRVVVLGGEEVHAGDVEVYKKHFSEGSYFINGLGSSESSLTLQYLMTHETSLTGNSVPVGYPVEDLEITLLEESGQDGGLYGEIIVKGPQVALGYWHNPELTQKTFQSNSCDSSSRIYRSGDMGRLLPNGAIEFAGRKDHQVKIRGFRIETGEIEVALESHSQIEECVVIARQDNRHAKHLVAYMVGGPTIPSDSQLREFLKQKLPGYMIPSAFVFLDSLPLTANGKINRGALPMPNFLRTKENPNLVAPRTTTEQMLVEIWQHALNLDHIGITEDFFTLGGHSLMAIQVRNLIREFMGIDIPLRTIFDSPTISELGKALERYQSESELHH